MRRDGLLWRNELTDELYELPSTSRLLLREAQQTFLENRKHSFPVVWRAQLAQEYVPAPSLDFELLSPQNVLDLLLETVAGDADFEEVISAQHREDIEDDRDRLSTEREVLKALLRQPGVPKVRLPWTPEEEGWIDQLQRIRLKDVQGILARRRDAWLESLAGLRRQGVRERMAAVLGSPLVLRATRTSTTACANLHAFRRLTAVEQESLREEMTAQSLRNKTIQLATKKRGQKRKKSSEDDDPEEPALDYFEEILESP